MAHDRALNDEAFQFKHALNTHVLELAYEKTLRSIDVSQGAENERRLRLSLLLLEDENNDLQEQLALEDDRIDSLEKSTQDVQNQLDVVESTAERLRADLRLKTREVETLKAELNSLQNVSMDSTKLLTEKLALSRELTTLKPELEHLRSQVASNQSLLAEKLSLQRQLSNAQVELETEKRAKERALAKDSGRQAQDAKLEAQLDSMQAELAKERRERQRIEREAQKATSEFEGQQTILETRLESFRTKLRTTKDQLKETQAELAKAQVTAAKQASTFVHTANNNLKNPRKRGMTQVDTSTAIGTPGDYAGAKRTRRAPSVVPGEKSTFSITPFLNRTANIAPDSPGNIQPSIETAERAINEVDNDDDQDHDEPTITSVAAAAAGSPSTRAAQKTITKSSKQAVLKESKSAKANAKPGPGRKPKLKPALEQVREEGDDNDENQEIVASSTADTIEAPPGPSVTISTTATTLSSDKLFSRALSRAPSEEPTFIKRKRKLLGGGNEPSRTLFDEDEGGVEKGVFGAIRGFNSLGSVKGFGGLGAGKLGGVGRTAALSATSGFGAFSPLKKDRRAAASSTGAG